MKTIIYKDLQEYFETLSASESIGLSERTKDASKMSPEELVLVANLIKQVYSAEMDVDFPNDDNLLNELFGQFHISVSIWANVQKGHMRIKHGRLMLKDGNARLEMTKAGRRHVEENLLPKLGINP